MKKKLLVLCASAVIVAAVTIFLISTARSQQSGAVTEGDHLTATVGDGLILHAWKSDAVLSDGDHPAKPGLALLLPMMQKTHESYDPFTKKLNDIGYTTLAFDLRGHGLSNRIGADSISASSMTSDDFARIPSDIERFFEQFRASQSGTFDERNVVIIGASIGANTAAVLLDRDWVSRVVLLSPGRDYRGLVPEAIMADTAHEITKPIYMAVSIDDTYAANSSQWLFDHYRGPKMFKRYPGMDHGTNILHNVKDADQELLDWVKRKK